jgi:signal transduction histidine kinase
LGLLVTELVLNAIKHAFKSRDRGTIGIRLEVAGRGLLRLIVEDDGTGLPPAEARAISSGVGMKLLDGFLHQLEGTLTVDGPPGTRFVVMFPGLPPDRRVHGGARLEEPELRVSNGPASEGRRPGPERSVPRRTPVHATGRP